MGQNKKILREKGTDGHAIAPRLGRLAKVCNGRAHPDVSLAADIEAFLQGARKYEGTSGTPTTLSSDADDVSAPQGAPLSQLPAIAHNREKGEIPIR